MKVEIETITKNVVVHAYVHKPITKNVVVHAYVHKPGYTAITKIRSERANALDVLTQEFQCVANALRRAKEFAVALGLETEVDRLMKLVGAREVVIIRRARLSATRSTTRPQTKRSRR